MVEGGEGKAEEREGRAVADSGGSGRGMPPCWRPGIEILVHLTSVTL